MGSGNSKPCDGWSTPCYGGTTNNQSTSPDTLSIQSSSDYSEQYVVPPVPPNSPAPYYSQQYQYRVPPNSPAPYYSQQYQYRVPPNSSEKGKGIKFHSSSSDSDKGIKFHSSSSDSDNAPYLHRLDSDRSGPSQFWSQYDSSGDDLGYSSVQPSPYVSSDSSYGYTPNSGSSIDYYSSKSSSDSSGSWPSQYWASPPPPNYGPAPNQGPPYNNYYFP